MSVENSPAKPRRTLGLTGITINAMALTAPGALIWLLYQVQAGAAVGGMADIWPGVLLALAGAVLTAFSFGELARRYPEAGFRSAYHFADRYFATQRQPHHPSFIKLAKLAIGWSAHLYYWVYPGVMVAFMGVLADYLLRYFGYHPTIFGEALLAVAFIAFIGFLALRGISGSFTTSVALNTIQLIALFLFSVLAIIFRLTNPEGFAPTTWLHASAGSVVTPHSLNGLLFQGGLAMILMVGFESSTVLKAAASNPGQDIPRGAILALIIQGACVYLIGYFAAGFALNAQVEVAASHAPIGDLAVQIGNALLHGYGLSLMVFIGLTIGLALFGATLTAINNGVRISFAMAIDEEMPDVLGLFSSRYATPRNAVLLLCAVSAIVGAAGVLGGLPALMGIVLASNLGAFLLYALLCVLTVATFVREESFSIFRHGILPVLGLAANGGMIFAVVGFGLTSGGAVMQASLVALGLAAFWLIVSVAYYFINRMR